MKNMIQKRRKFLKSLRSTGYKVKRIHVAKNRYTYQAVYKGK